MTDEAGGYDAAFDAFCSENDARRKASPIDHSDEIAMLERALASPLPFTLAGIETMQQRLLLLKDEQLLLLKAAAGLLPLKGG